MAVMEANINSLMPHITLHLHIVGLEEFRARRWLAIRCMKLAAHILGCNITIEDMIIQTDE